jgi:RecJ-like exonuclease
MSLILLMRPRDEGCWSCSRCGYKSYGWEACSTCRGNGLLARPDPRRRHVGGDDDRRGELLICPDCLRTRRIPVLRIAGQVPELLLATFDAGGTAPALTQAPGLVMPFEADSRVA